jgi:alpha-galactosidase
LLLGSIPTRLAGAAPADSGSSITHDVDRKVWTLRNDTVEWQVSGDPGTPVAGLTEVRVGGDQRWPIADGVDGVVTIDGRERKIGWFRDGVVVNGVSAMRVTNGVQLDLAMRVTDVSIVVTRHYALYDDSPVLELWTTVQSLDPRPHVLADLNSFTVAVPSGVCHWLNGLQGDAAGVNADAGGVNKEAAFTMQARTLNDGESLRIGSTRRSSEQQLPWITVVNDSSTFFAGVMWSGAWTLTATRASSRVSLNAGLAKMQTTVTSGPPLEGPHGFIGAAPGGTSGVSRAMERFITNGVRAGHTLKPLVTYNPWFVYGVDINEDGMRGEMDRAAALGVELFVLDAGWYTGAGRDDDHDFESGLGTWDADPSRFPSGLRALSDYAHGLGMSFGLWVEPERLDRSAMDGTSLNERWLATSGGGYQSAHTAQICLASSVAREYLFGKLTALLDAVKPDYLKWDNNFWINCDRGGHGHGPSDGNFAHTRGLYDLLERLRKQYPSLQIENVSGGGNRLDLGMLRYTDVAWMDDRTAPSALVRHNLEGLSSVMPPAYLLSFVIENATESLHQAADLALYLRSRMAGVLGLCIRTGDYSASDLADIAGQVATYKSLRNALAAGSATLLTAQAAVTNGPAWDALQVRAGDGQSLVIGAFQADTGTKTTIAPDNLDPSATYDVRSLDAGSLGAFTGADLMRVGFEPGTSTDSAAHFFILTRRDTAEAVRRR